MIEPLAKSFDRVEVESFLSVKRADVTLSDITAIIGPQASGKSVIAKLFFFGRSHIEDYFNSVLAADYDTRSFKAERLASFLSLFDGLQGFDGAFKVRYTYGDMSICVIRDKPKHKPRISHSKELDRLATSVKREYRRAIEKMKSTGSRRRPVSRYFFINESEAAKEFYGSLPDCLFVPASRSFYSTVSEELFSFLAADERIDPLTAQFGSFFEFAKRKISAEIYGAVSSEGDRKKFNNTIKPVIGGEYIREKSKDYIRTSWGKVPLRVSSSGQQEAFPLLITLSEYPEFGGSKRGRSRLLIIEEPEAHLFPTAQKYILDYIVQTTRDSDCDMLFTTHSPYVLSCLNTHILRSEKLSINDGRKLTYAAYLADAQCTRSIMDDETGLIETGTLDEASEMIAAEFVEAM